MEIDYNGIGHRIKKCRKQLKLTQAQLAEMSDLSDTNISHIERGATKLSLPSLISIANALNTTTDYLLMDVIHNSQIQFEKEFADLLQNCNKDEYKLLYDICKATLESQRKGL